MAIRINLLAEEQFLAEMRRRDPVKRSAYLGALLAGLALCWWGWLLYAKSGATSALANSNAAITKIEKSAKEVADHQKRTTVIEGNIHALHRSVTNRVLWAGCLNALQEVTREPIQITRVRIDQNYNVQTAVISKDRTKNKPASSTETIKVTITARDYGAADQNYIKFKDRVEAHPWFKQHLAKDNPISFRGFTAPTPDKDDPSRVFVSFTMECDFTERFRN